MLKRTINFLKYRWIAFGFSLTLFAVFTSFTVYNGGMVMGVDFVGGVKIIAKFSQGIDEEKIRTALKDFNPSVQQIGSSENNEYIVSTKLESGKETSLKESEKLKAALTEKFAGVEFRSVENVGPAVGSFLKRSALKLSIVAIVLMMVYLSFRFEFKYSLGVMAALMHDIIITTAFVGFARVEFNIPVVAALLTIFGFSVNDTIVIFDRVRENLQNETTKVNYLDLINRSITETMSRTILTTLTVIFSVLSLYLLGGEGLNDFAKVLLFGLFVGTYSTVYLASPVLVAMEKLTSK